jgi:hypothetical protein
MSTDGIAYSIGDTHPGVGVIFRFSVLLMDWLDWSCEVLMCAFFSKFCVVELCFDEC